MNSKWYTSTLFLLLFICLGTFQEKVVIPNQEIVLEFVDGEINNQDIQNTIILVKEQLENVGATNISIQKSKAGALIISYYSGVHVDDIKKALSKENQIALHKNSENNQPKLPSSTYNIDIYELSNEIDATNLNDKYVFEIKYISERSTTTHSYVSFRCVNVYKANQLFKTAYNVYKSSPLAKDKTAHKEPEVRAGPNYFNS